MDIQAGLNSRKKKDKRQKMKINIFYATWFSNGEKLMEELAGILEGSGNEVKLYCVNKDVDGDIGDADLYIFSSPTRKFSLPSEMEKFIAGFTPKAEGEKYALATTYLDPRTIALKKIQALLEKKKMIKAADDLKIRVKNLKGPLEENYIKRLQEFAGSIN